MIIRHINLLMGVLLLAIAPALGGEQNTYTPTYNTPYAKPLDIPLLFSANYGELRGNHFHSGVDIKTQGGIGKKVYALAAGYVSRISVSPSGFGKAIYVAHPDGTTSVYGHVERFTDQIDAYVHEQQYAKKSFKVELYPPRIRFQVRAGELIAYSGNRGSSGGPHLHLELRDGAQRPLNLFAHKIVVALDTIAPRPVTLYWVAVDTLQGVPVHRIQQQLPIEPRGTNRYAVTAPISTKGAGYLAIEVQEKKNGTHNPMGVYRLRASHNERPYFEMTIDRIPFDISRYAYTAALYSESRTKRNGVYRLYCSPNNPLPIYKGVIDRGILTRSGSVEVLLEDDCGNSSTLTCTLQATPSNQPATSAPTTSLAAHWDKSWQLDDAGLRVVIPAGALYESTLIKTDTRPQPPYAYSPIYQIHTPDEPLQKSITLSIDASTLPERLRSKALLGILSPTGTRQAAGGAWQEGRVESKVRAFGAYYIAVDTLPPRIVAEFREGADLTSKKRISLIIIDDFSGINTISATIDNQWALMEYDPKSNRITHLFDDTRWPTSGKHTLQLTVRDTKGNQSTYTGSYTR